MDESFKPEFHPTHHRWYSSIVDSLNNDNPSSFTTPSSLLYTYDHAFQGFSASLSPQELENLKKSSGFISAYSDKTVILDTTYSTAFLSLNPPLVYDLLPTMEKISLLVLSILGYGRREGQEFNSSMCNYKLIGARYFKKGVIAANPNINISMNSTRDTDGHGTHTASTTIGNYVEDVSYFGYAKGTARGVVPGSRLAVYKVIWDEGRYASDVLAAMDQAIVDGVDVISIYMGFDRVPLNEDPIAMASFGAMEKSVFVSSAAGNSGPALGTLHNGIPWMLTVAAGTMETLTFGNGQTIVGWTLFPENAIVEDFPLIYNKTISSCNSSKLLSNFVNEGIIIYDDTFLVHDQIKKVTTTQLLGAIFISNSTERLFELGQITCPGDVIGPKDGYSVIKYAESSKNPTVSIKFKQTFHGTKPAPLAAVYSSRGPSSRFPNILKPDIMAPGTRILAVYIPNIDSATIGSNVFLSSNYNILSGTSMSYPHASGICNDTAANPLDNTRNPILDNGNDLEFASPLAIGSGQIDPNSALNPGLIYDATPQDYVNLLSSMNFTSDQIFAITRSKAFNFSNPSFDLNYPSFIAFYDNQTVSRIEKFERTVTNVGNGMVKYKAMVIAPASSEVTVSPVTLVFGKKYEKQSYTLTIKYSMAKRGKVSFGEIVWVEENGKHTVRGSIAVSPAV
ncbi:hypothetical protein FEM48_Zijuj02G0180800 [Ziziphus jujuba var. spinosa]|uniref:Subtilisin-like protease SBT1.9 n=1 Tax=Ziziphus jujuba var. spinosa TaxID=714518 RepID=A0A978VX63_ZIZJJ|nr:hypothetical protein FEM48_Zijuj02G0180800 [Ziziphus jujuba var. spinosa]